MLTDSERERYDRQLRIPDFGEAGQEKLKAATVFIAGAGGLGSPAAYYLAAAGVDRLLIADNDVVGLSNLNRQVLHGEPDLGKAKPVSAVEKLHHLNPNVIVETITETIDESKAADLVGDADGIVDALDNLPTRYLLNRVAQRKGIPFFHGAVYGFEGRVMTVLPGTTACLNCLYHGAEGSGGTFPVVGVTAGVIGCLQANEVIKYLTGLGELLTNRLLIYDGLSAKFAEMKVKRDPACGHCGPGAGR
jgi:molybdopterin/thiamine biosynthesis adenylyltransferase